MASDDRPDDRRRFTLRRFLTPSDEPDAAAEAEDPGELAAAAGPEAFGTGDVDDDALDAIVQGAGPSALVWGADEVPDPVPGDLPTAEAADPFADASDGAETVEAPDDDDWALSFDSAVLDEDPAETGADGASVLGAFADAIEPDDLDPEADDEESRAPVIDFVDVSAPDPEALPADDDATHADASDAVDETADAEADVADAEPEATAFVPEAAIHGVEDVSLETADFDSATLVFEPHAADPDAEEADAVAEPSDAEVETPDTPVETADAVAEGAGTGTEATDPRAGMPDPEAESAEPEPEASITEPEASISEPEASISEPEAAEPEPEAAEPEAADTETDVFGAAADGDLDDHPAGDEGSPEPVDASPDPADAFAEATDTAPDPADADPDPADVAPAGDGAAATDPPIAAAAALSDSLPPDPDPTFMETAEIDADLATADPTAAVDDAFEMQTDPAKAGAAGADGIEGDLEVTPLGPDDFEPDELRAVLRTMMTSRKLDEKMLTLLKQGKGFFHIGSAGHEASQTAVARQFEGGSDWFCFYYRDLATALTVGLEPADVFRAHYGKASDPFGGGRQMPEHFGHRELNIMSTSSSVGAQYVPAVGFALACKREDGDGPRRAVYTSGGEGSTSQGAFHEALNWAAREALPVLFHIQDNKYAISVPVEEQTAGGSIWHLLGGYAGLRRLRYDGTDFFQSAAAAKAAMDHIRAGHGPVALHADLVRLLPHSSSDDHKKYREAASLEADAARDPIPRFAAQLVEAGVMTDDEVEALRAEVAAEIDRLAKEIEKEADPDPATATRHVYYEGPDDREYEVEGEAGDLIVMVDAINHALDEEMSRDERVLVYGEDVGGGKGGVFTATRGLTAKHGRDRCFNSPLAEHSVLGSAVGLACAGYKPVVEIQFADYIWPGMQPLRNQIASMRYRSDGAWACPMVIRVPAGGYIHGGLCHSQNIEAIFGHFPGLHVVMPSNAADAKGLLKSAIRGQDPVLFLEHKALYRQGPARRPEPHGEYLVPLGKAAVTREGTDLTIVTWGAIVYKALAAAKALEKEGVSVEVVDVRSFLPFDSETVLASVKKTGRVLIAYEDHEFMGFGAEIAAQVADGAFGHLDAPVKRVAGAFSSIPYADPLEKAVLPQDADVLDAAREVLAY